MVEQLKDYQKAAQQKRRDDLIVSHLPLVKHVLGRVVGELPPGVDIENLESAGVLGSLGQRMLAWALGLIGYVVYLTMKKESATGSNTANKKSDHSSAVSR